MSESVFDFNALHDSNLDMIIEEDAVASLRGKIGSLKNNLFIQCMSPLKLRLKVIELLLLTVAFGSELEAKECWKNLLITGPPLEDLDTANYSIFPALTKRLHEIAPHDRSLEKLKGHYKYTWTKNQLKLKELSECIALLKANGIPCLVSKEPGLSLLSQSEHEVRQICGMTLLVTPETYDRAMSITSDGDISVRLVKHLFGKTDALTWKEAVPLQICGVQALSLSTVDLFFQHLLSAKFERINQREWFADCVRLLSSLNEETHTKQILDRVEKSRDALIALQAWCLFLRIGEMTHYELKESSLSNSLASLNVTYKELFHRSSGRFRAALRSNAGRG
jgi:hypothetical protein